MSERILYYDYIRITAMLLVVACHCFGDTEATSPAVISLLSYIEMPCIGLFLAVSGALLLPVTLPTEKFLGKRLNKVVFPTLFWSMVYMLLGDTLTIGNLIGMAFRPVGSGILWFMYTIIGLYFISPVISPWLAASSKRTIGIYLLLWAASLCFPIVGNWVEIREGPTGMFYYLSGYAGFFVLGYYLKRFGISFKISAVLYVVALIAMIVVKLFAPHLELCDGLWYLSIFCAVSVVFYWNSLKFLAGKTNASGSWAKKVGLISNLVFGVYFVHIGIVKYIINESFMNSGGYLIGYFARIAAVFLIALFISYIISLLPFGDYLIGFRQKRK